MSGSGLVAIALLVLAYAAFSRRLSGSMITTAMVFVAGATCNEIVATLEAVTPVAGAARVVQCAAQVALALGYEVEEALEQLDVHP